MLNDREMEELLAQARSRGFLVDGAVLPWARRVPPGPPGPVEHGLVRVVHGDAGLKLEQIVTKT